MAFGFDITDLVKPAPRKMCWRRGSTIVGLSREGNRTPFQWNDRNFYANYGGINKNVYLHITDPLHQTLPLFSNLGTTGVYVYAQRYRRRRRSPPIVTAESRRSATTTRQPRTVHYDVRDSRHGWQRVVATFGGAEDHTGAGEDKDRQSVERRSTIFTFWSWGYGYLYNVTPRSSWMAGSSTRSTRAPVFARPNSPTVCSR